MDPNAALETLRSAAKTINNAIENRAGEMIPDWADPLELLVQAAEEAATAIEALDQWLGAGGFLPHVWQPTPEPKTLDELYRAIVAGDRKLDDRLPTFGGDDIDEVGVWSWDATRIMAGTCADDLTLDLRTDTYANIELPSGFTVYHRTEAMLPDLHQGEWFYEPTDWDTADVYSEGYDTKAEAAAACRKWSDEQEAEKAARIAEDGRLKSYYERGGR